MQPEQPEATTQEQTGASRLHEILRPESLAFCFMNETSNFPRAQTLVSKAVHVACRERWAMQRVHWRRLIFTDKYLFRPILLILVTSLYTNLLKKQESFFQKRHNFVLI